MSEPVATSRARLRTSRPGRVGGLGRWLARILGALTGSTRARALTLVGVIAVLTVGVFGTYLLGLRIPPWDFMGGYTTEAYYWWEHGSFFSPVEWIPSNWGGYPSAVILQNSAWYLPMGLASLFGPLTLYSTAVVCVLHVAFGAFGAFALVRRLGQRYGVAVFAAVAWFFAVGFFSNAEHPDIARGYAWVPWVLLVLTPRWPWRRWWSVPVAALILWQAATGIYPGMVLAAIYVVACWVVVAFFVFRPRPVTGYLIRVAGAGLAAGLLCGPRLWPYLQFGSVASGDSADTSEFSWAQIGTLAFGYGSDDLPNDISMRSFFIPAAVLVLVAYARWRDPIAKLGVTLFVPAFVLGMPFWPWFTAIQNLPGLGPSRFTMSDFKVFMILGVLLVALSGLTRLLGLRFESAARRQVVARRALAVNAGLLVVLGTVGVLGPYSLTDWAPGLFFVFLAAGLCAATAAGWWRTDAPNRVASGGETPGGTASGSVASGRAATDATWLVVALGLVTVLSGLVWAVQCHQVWLADRVSTEKFTYGATVADLIADGKTEGADDATTVRPARTPLPLPITEKNLNAKRWNAATYTGRDAVGGYINLKGTPTGKALAAALLSKSDGPTVAAFLAAPGTVLTPAPESNGLVAALDDCLDGDCGPVDAAPFYYHSSSFGYTISVPVSTTALLNEPYYPGRTARACVDSGPCREVPLSMDRTGLIRAELPEGGYRLMFSYETPGRTAGWWAFWSGVALLVAASVVGAVRGRGRVVGRRTAARG